jgi:uncharacterized protein YjdB
MKNKVFGIIVVGIILCWIMVACHMDEQIVDEVVTENDDSSTETLTEVMSIALSSTSLNLVTGDSIQLSVVSNNVPADAETTWISSNSDVASVDQTGNVVAVSQGSATITIIVNGMSATCQIIVTGKEVSATAVAVSPATISLTSVAQTSQLSTSITPLDATNVTYSWTSSNTSVAMVSQSGLVTAVASGTTVITVTTNGGLKATSTITVSILSTTTTTKYSVNSSSCTGCGKCKSACSYGAISISSGKAIIDASKCTACGKCYSRCPRGAIVKTITTSN